MGELTPYKDYLAELAERHAVRTDEADVLPVWLENSIRAYRWMFRLHRDTARNRIGYTVSGQLRFRLAHAPETHFRTACPIMVDVRAMLFGFCSLLEDLDTRLLSRFPEGETAVLAAREDRVMWDEARGQIQELLWHKKPPETPEPPILANERQIRRLRVRYAGPAETPAFVRDKAYGVVSVERGQYRIMTELRVDGLFPPQCFEVAEGEMPEDVFEPG